MKLTLKISLAILVLSLLSISLIGLISYTKGKGALELAIKQEALIIVSEKMNVIDKYLYDEVHDLQFYVTSPTLQEAILAQNAALAGEDNNSIESMLQRTDTEWRATPKNESSPLMKSILGNEASAFMRERREFFKNKSGFDVYSEMFITDKYGGNVAMTGRTSDYRQDDEDWWQLGRRDGFHVGDVEFDESAGVYSVDISVRIEDKEGNFIGVAKSVLDISEAMSLVEESSTLAAKNSSLESLTISYKLLNKNGQIIYSTEDFTIFENGSIYLEDVFGLVPFDLHPIGSKILHERGAEENALIAIHVHSDGFHEFEGLGWTLVMVVGSGEFYRDVIQFKRVMGIIIAAVILAIVILSLWLSRAISQPLLRLEYAMMHARSGNFDIPVDIKRNDEMGSLARSFEIMRAELRKTHVKLKEHEKELEDKVQQRTKELNEKIAEASQSNAAVLNMIEDIHDANRQLVDAQAKLHGNLAKLKNLDTQKDQFISIAAHELKTPLTSIKGFSDLLRKPIIVENKELRDKYLSIIFEDAGRLGKLITNILELSRMDIGTLKIAWEEIPPSDLLKEVKDQMDIIITGKGLKSEYVVEDNLPSIAMDKDKIVQVLSNLINNAVHYTEKGQITLNVRRKDNDILFSVSDTGEGMPMEAQGKIFTRFYQVDSPLTRKIGGTGLGLSLSKGFVEAMGGRIWFESEFGKGTTFSFTLPIKKMTKVADVNLFKSPSLHQPANNAASNVTNNVPNSAPHYHQNKAQ